MGRKREETERDVEDNSKNVQEAEEGVQEGEDVYSAPPPHIVHDL